MYRAEYPLLCIGNNGGNVGLSQNLWQVDPMSAHMGTERTHHAGLSDVLKLHKAKSDYIFGDEV